MSSFPGLDSEHGKRPADHNIARSADAARKPNFDRFEICGGLECNRRKGYVIWRFE